MTHGVDRRAVLKTLGAVAAGVALSRHSFAEQATGSAPKHLRGLFPIGQTPFTPDDKLDLDCLTAEVKFCNRASVPGFIWPQIASGWSTLSASERFAGAEAILAAGKGGGTALVIGVQTQNNDLQGAIAFAKHAAGHGADAICSLPPDGRRCSDAELLQSHRQRYGSSPVRADHRRHVCGFDRRDVPFHSHHARGEG
jgi:hypothetical protein